MSSKFASDKVEPKVLARYEEESETAQQDFTDFQTARRQLSTEIASLQKQLPEIEMSITKVELDVENGKKRVVEAERRLTELQYVPSLSPFLHTLSCDHSTRYSLVKITSKA